MCKKSSEINTAINLEIPDSQITDEKTLEKGDSEFQDEIDSILNDMKRMNETNSRSSRNMENLTIAIATLTIVSIILGAASLTIISAEEIFSIFSGGVILFCWTIGIFAVVIGIIIAFIIFDRDDYIPQKPALSHIIKYKKYGRLQMTVGALILWYLYLLGFVHVFLSQLISNNTDPNLTFISSLILIIIISFIMIVIFWKKYYSHTKSCWSYYHLTIIPLIIEVIILILYSFRIVSNTAYIGIIGAGLLFYGYFLVAICVLIYIIITIFSFRSQLSVEDWYEYKSDAIHVGVIVSINSRNPLSLSDIFVKRLVKRLVKHLLRSEENPYRVYFCSTKKDVETQLKNSSIHDFWIFGSGNKNILELSDGKFEYNSWLKKENLASKNIHRVLNRKDVNNYISDWELKHIDE